MFLSQSFKGALSKNFKQFTCINHILLALCEQIVAWCENEALHVSFLLPIQACGWFVLAV